MKKTVAIVLVAALLAAVGCATPSQRTKTQGTVGGAAVGAGIGYVIGGRGGAWLGGLLGGILGYAVGAHVADEKSKYASQEKWLDACLKQTNKANADAKAYNAQLNRKVQRLEEESLRKMALYEQKKVKISEVRSTKGKVAKQMEETKKVIAAMEEDVAKYDGILKKEKIKNGEQHKALQQQVAEMRAKVDAMKSQVERLAALPVNSV